MTPILSLGEATLGNTSGLGASGVQAREEKRRGGKEAEACSRHLLSR